ncbi:hypothetical protein KAI87_07495, partial [Myxococcota bacterium]|nr:hypothetical protein [Myxococcota bacterium]
RSYFLTDNDDDGDDTNDYLSCTERCAAQNTQSCIAVVDMRYGESYSAGSPTWIGGGATPCNLEYPTTESVRDGIYCCCNN